MEKTHKIITLPTEDKVSGCVAKCIKKMSDVEVGELKFFNSYMTLSTEHWQPQYIYILSDDKIQEGDWFMSAFYSYPIHNTKEWREKQEKLLKGSSDCSDLKYHKIIATNNPELNMIQYPSGVEDDGVKEILSDIELPQIPQSFIESYANNPVDEVELEYEIDYSSVSEEDAEELGSMWRAALKDKLKLVNNEVVIVNKCNCSSLIACEKCGEKKNLDGDFWKNKKEKEKLYTKKEVEKLICKASKDTYITTCRNDYRFDIDKWIKNNLK